MARQLHQHIVGLHRPRLVVEDLFGPGPHVFTIVKVGRFGHLVGAKNAGLDAEQIVWIADVCVQIFGHLLEGGEQVRKDAGVGSRDWLVRLHQIELHLTGVSVNDHLDRIADIVETGPQRPRPRLARLAVGKRPLTV